MPVGTATSIVVSIVTNLSVGSIPDVNMWWPYTINDTTPIPAIAYTIDRYPNTERLALVAITSDMIPNAGTITT